MIAASQLEAAAFRASTSGSWAEAIIATRGTALLVLTLACDGFVLTPRPSTVRRELVSLPYPPGAGGVE
jgi:hypothetical protein